MIPKMKNMILSWETRKLPKYATETGVTSWAQMIASKVSEFANNDVRGLVTQISRQVGLDVSHMEDYEETRSRVIAFGSGYNSIIGDATP